MAMWTCKIMNFPDQDGHGSVILSAAKNLSVGREILRGAQNDIPGFGCEISLFHWKDASAC